MKKVFIGLSGGVDSAVSAALLKERGFALTGVFIKIWQPEFIECTWKEDRIDAMRVCVSLGIPFREIDLSNEYKKGVINAMIEGYRVGITPNPDVLCNRSIKFGSFASWALRNGAEYIATGHYAQIREQNGSYQLLRGLDRQKDQSYFLNLLNQEDLSHALFPIGTYEKRNVREMARKFGLPVAEKRDSQGLCFVGDISMDDFLSRYLRLSPGNVVDVEGRVLGEHRGAALYTIGQRHGFTARANAPHFVTAIDTKANSIRVSANREDATVKSAFVRNMNWIEGKAVLPLRAEAQSRYREAPFPVTIERKGDEYLATFDESRLVSSGQSLVVYEKDRVLGGGVIMRA